MSLPAAPLVRILLSLAVNVGLFSAVCTYLACFSPSAGLFQPLSAQSSVRCRRFSRFSVKFRCSPQSLVRFRYSPQLGFRHTQWSFARFRFHNCRIQSQTLLSRVGNSGCLCQFCQFHCWEYLSLSCASALHLWFAVISHSCHQKLWYPSRLNGRHPSSNDYGSANRRGHIYYREATLLQQSLNNKQSLFRCSFIQGLRFTKDVQHNINTYGLGIEMVKGKSYK